MDREYNNHAWIQGPYRTIQAVSIFRARTLCNGSVATQFTSFSVSTLTLALFEHKVKEAKWVVYGSKLRPGH